MRGCLSPAAITTSVAFYRLVYGYCVGSGRHNLNVGSKLCLSLNLKGAAAVE